MTYKRRGRAAARSLARAQSLGMDLAMLGWDSASVIGLRTVKLMQGGEAGRKEADRMVAEKVAALAELPWVLAAKARSPEAAAKVAVGHFAKKVRANRRRLGGKSKKPQ